MHKGGSYKGCGSYGKVYGDPRLPCANETVQQVANLNEVSKLFNSDMEMMTEYDVINRFERHFSQNDFNKLHNFCILPIKQCFIDPNTIRKNAHIYGTKQWKQCPKGNNDKLIFTKEGFGDLDQFKPMIVYPKGNQTVSDAFHEQNHTPEHLFNHLHGILNLLFGVQLFQQNDFIHADIKTSNAVVCDDGKYRFIDMAMSNKITEITDMARFTRAFNYFAYPPTAIYLRWFDPNAKTPTIQTISNNRFVPIIPSSHDSYAIITHLSPSSKARYNTHETGFKHADVVVRESGVYPNIAALSSIPKEISYDNLSFRQPFNYNSQTTPNSNNFSQELYPLSSPRKIQSPQNNKTPQNNMPFKTPIFGSSIFKDVPSKIKTKRGGMDDVKRKLQFDSGPSSSSSLHKNQPDVVLPNFIYDMSFLTVSSFNEKNWQYMQHNVIHFMNMMKAVPQSESIVMPIMEQWFHQKTYFGAFGIQPIELRAFISQSKLTNLKQLFDFKPFDAFFNHARYQSYFVGKHDEMLAYIKRDILMRIDIYSMGIILLECLGHYCAHRLTTRAIDDPNEIQLIIRLCEMIQQCIGQFDKCAQINIIIDNLQMLIQMYEHPILTAFFDLRNNMAGPPSSSSNNTSENSNWSSSNDKSMMFKMDT